MEIPRRSALRSLLLLALSLAPIHIALAQDSDARALPRLPDDIPPASPARRTLVEVLAGVPIRAVPWGAGHRLRAQLPADPKNALAASACDTALSDFYILRRLMQQAQLGQYPAEVPRLAEHLAQDSEWLTAGWSTCEARFGPLYGYTPLAKPGVIPTKEAILAEADMTGAQCEDLENRLSELQSWASAWNGPGARGREPDARNIFEGTQNQIFMLKQLRIRCPALVTRIKADLADKRPLSTQSAPTAWTPPPPVGLPAVAAQEPPHERKAPASVRHKAGYRVWAGDDCRGLVRGSDANCRSSDCRALVRNNDVHCETNDCRAILRNNDAYCDTNDCRAILRDNDAYCDTDDCRAIIRDNDANCSSDSCRAIVREEDAFCR